MYTFKNMNKQYTYFNFKPPHLHPCADTPPHVELFHHRSFFQRRGHLWTHVDQQPQRTTQSVRCGGVVVDKLIQATCMLLFISWENAGTLGMVGR